jgi:transcriptional regulator with XRE-family HTH domain
MTESNEREQVWHSLDDFEYRHQFVNEEISVGIAFQIRSLRNRQILKQTDLAKILNVKQSQISAWENPNYGKYSLQTLKDLAKAFDVGLLVKFVPFSALVDWTVNLTADDIAPLSFEEEQSFIYSLDLPTHGETKHKTPDTVSVVENFIEGILQLDDFPTTATRVQEGVHA